MGGIAVEDGARPDFLAGGQNFSMHVGSLGIGPLPPDAG
jgi:hypothetical protein